MEFFTGKKAVVTGAGQGIGKGIATALYHHKAHVIAVDNNRETLTTLKQECSGIETVILDLSNWDETRARFESFEAVDILVNNAAIGRDLPFLETSKGDIDALINTNFVAVMNTMQVIGKSMKERGTGGAIVNISSVLSGKLDLPDKSIYGATKAAVEKITKAAAFELGKYKIRINSIHPSTTLTPYTKDEVANPEMANRILSRTALGRFSEVDDIVHPVLFLLNDEMSAMVHGESLMVDGGLR